MPPTAHRYTLHPYTGPKSRPPCPACGQPRCFTRYLDADTGELLPDAYGRCDRETKCGYHRSPYHARPGVASYAQQVRQQERAGYPMRTPSAFCRPRPGSSPQPVGCIPAAVFTATLGGYERNALAGLLRGHFGLGVAHELLRRFHLGTSAYWPGACVFWLLDEQGQVRGGQVVLYDDTGHTVKTPSRHTTWAHTALARACQRRGQPAPAWLADYAAHAPKSPCLFGLPQLASAPAGQPVALVESAKTAMLATPYFPGYLWLATMGLSFLTPERVAPLRGRRLVLFPDAGALAPWQRRADELRALGYEVTVSAYLETTATPAQHAAGADLADVLLAHWPGYPPSWDLDAALQEE